MKILEQKTKIGKCVICQGSISNDDTKWYNDYSVIYQEKIICGICLVNLNGASIEALNSFGESDEELSLKDKTMADWGVYVDPDTGKIVSKGIKKAKA